MDRPSRWSEAVLVEAATRMAPEFANWCQEPVSDDLVKCLAKAMRHEYDGYKIARNLENYSGVDPDEELVDILSGCHSIVDDALKNAEQQWVKYREIAPKHKVGDRVRCRHGEGTVREVYADIARYGVNVPPQAENAYWIVEAEDVSAAEPAEASA